jgi:hypothetical protein
MRQFSSYGPIDKELHYYVPRQELVDRAFDQLLGANPDKGGHYITVWAPRQRGKTWIMQQVLAGLRDNPQYNQRFAVVKLNLEHLKLETDVNRIVHVMAEELMDDLGQRQIEVNTLADFYKVFTKGVLDRPLVLILDEFDALSERAISSIAGVFRNIYIRRQDEGDKPSAEKSYLLHGVALVGVRSVLGIENVTGSPFNVQRSLYIPNLTFDEVQSLFKQYKQESGQIVEQAVIEQVFYETQGQPGLTSWLGELLTESYNKHNPVITMRDFEIAYAAAVDALPNANILNIISKARQEPYKQLVLEMFQTDEKIPFRYDDQRINFLYLNGVLDQEVVQETQRYLKFPCPFVQKRLFNYFAHDIFQEMGQLYKPFENLQTIITDEGLNIKNLMRRYERYLQENRDWLFKEAPRKTNLRLYEAVYHFNLYMYLAHFLQRRNGQVYPEFPTGNGKIDLIIKYADQIYGLELKSYVDAYEYHNALKQAAGYGQQLQLSRISLIFFVEAIDEDNRTRYEAVYLDKERGVTVEPVFVATGS